MQHKAADFSVVVYSSDRDPRCAYGNSVRGALRDTVPSMLGTIAVVLLVLWLLGMVSSTTVGGFIHVLLVVAIVVILIQFIQGRPVFGR